MKQNFALTLSLMGGLLLLTACVKEKTDDEKLRPVGSEIIFSAATSYDNDDRTRTVYTGKDENGQDVSTSSSIERIDWENDDRVSIVYVPGSPSQAEYKVTNVVNPNLGDGWENNLADVVPSGSDKLVWAPAGSTDIFYAMYPTANGKHPNNDAHLVFSNNTANVQGVIPSSQSVDLSRTQSVPVPGNPNQTYNRYLPDMRYAYMVGYADDSCRDGSRVTIPFTPAVTAFNFIFKAASSVTVTGFEMSTVGAGNVGTTLAGDFNFNISGPKRRPDTQSGTIVGAAWNSNTVNRTGLSNDNGKTITVSFSQDITLSANQYLDFTVFTLPINQTGLTIKFHLKNGGAAYTKSLALKDDASTWHTFLAGKKHIVTNDLLAGDSVEYTFDVKFDDSTTEFSTAYTGGSKTYNVTSYARVGASKLVPVTWEAYEYRYRNGNDPWSEWSGSKPSWLTLTTSDTPPNTNPSSVQSKSSTLAQTASQSGTDALKNAAAKGSQSNPYDLSTHDYDGSPINKTTANCYIITSPGWYKFPLAYGNAYYNGSAISMTYAPNKSAASYYLTPFLKHDGTAISSPDISGALRAAIVWQDASNLVTRTNITISNGYVVFQVEQANIKEGNAVIAVYNSASGGTVLWSWHIWVTPFVNNLFYGENDVTLRGKTFMARNLGWCDNGELYRARQVEVHFRQQGVSGGATKTLTFSQGEASVEANMGSGPQYQWGRKDPIVPPEITTNNGVVNDKHWFDAGNSEHTTVDLLQGPITLGDGVKNPGKFIWINRPALTTYSGRSFTDWIGINSNNPNNYNAYFNGHYCNLWNYNATVAHDVTIYLTVNDFSSLTHGKTVYDPCPAGYTVPTPTELAVLAKDGGNMGGYNAYSGTEIMSWDDTRQGLVSNGHFIPANGYRFYLSGMTYVGEYRNYGGLQSSGYASAHVPLRLRFNKTDGYKMDVSSAKAMANSVRCVPE